MLALALRSFKTMDKGRFFVNLYKIGLASQCQKAGNLRSLTSLRYYSDQSTNVNKVVTSKSDKQREIKEDGMESELSDFVKDKPQRLPKIFQESFIKSVWIESKAVKEARKGGKLTDRLNHTIEWLRMFQGIQDYPTRPSELFFLLKKRKERKQLAEQKFLPMRHAVLRPDLAAAHFLRRRGGSVKFVGQTEWIGYKEKNSDLPLYYVPGFFVEGIKAENTNLYYEGLANLSRLRHLTYLSLKGLDTINDWCLDWISKEFCQTLTHLDLSHCKNVTYRGLSCFYRFECLKILDVTGISDSPEFKLACVMLQDVFPELEIVGISLEIPKEIKPVSEEPVEGDEEPVKEKEQERASNP